MLFMPQPTGSPRAAGLLFKPYSKVSYWATMFRRILHDNERRG